MAVRCKQISAPFFSAQATTHEEQVHSAAWGKAAVALLINVILSELARHVHTCSRMATCGDMIAYLNGAFDEQVCKHTLRNEALNTSCTTHIYPHTHSCYSAWDVHNHIYNIHDSLSLVSCSLCSCVCDLYDIQHEVHKHEDDYRKHFHDISNTHTHRQPVLHPSLSPLYLLIW